jgi:hypothetical protein
MPRLAGDWAIYPLSQGGEELVDGVRREGEARRKLKQQRAELGTERCDLVQEPIQEGRLRP